ncbi:MAG: RnfABCDGE type electron transport complex subunit G [Candidatus Latescibacter sp.]|nr:RnfABCDGE type electron transport complex subunit G [Candidatus Latescibacter sp.]
MRDIVQLGVILMIYSLAAGAALGYVNLKTKPIITANKTAAENSARLEVLPGMTGGFDSKGNLAVDGREFPWWIGYKDDAKKEPAGYVFIAKGKGYSSVVETMVGVGMDGKITGSKILSQQETPGLGTKILENRPNENDPSWFTRQFIGKSAEDNIKVKKDGGFIDAVTGATVTPRAITNSINKGLVKLKETVGGKS